MVLSAQASLKAKFRSKKAFFFLFLIMLCGEFVLAQIASPFAKNKIHINERSIRANLSAKDTFADGLVVTSLTSCMADVVFKNSKRKPLLQQESRVVYIGSQDLQQSLLKWQSDPCVIGVSENSKVRAGSRIVNKDPLLPQQRNLAAVGWTEALALFEASSFKSKSSVVVAIVDSGIDDTHEDLSDQLWSGTSGETGQSFVEGVNSPKDDYGHGSHVAGIVGAKKNNGLGVAGVISNGVKLIAIKVLDSNGDGSVASVSNGIRYAADQNADVINLSLGAPMRSATIQDALIYAINKGSFITVAAGNEGDLITAENFYAPIGYAPELQGLIGVGSIDAAFLTTSSFSNYSTKFVEIATFGSNGKNKIISTWMNGEYKEAEGTSMATPLVSGAAALIIAFFKTHSISYTPALVESVLLNSSTKNKSIESVFQQGRELNIANIRRYLETNYLSISRGGFDE